MIFRFMNVNKYLFYVSGLTTPAEMKLKLLPVFRFIYHDANIANEVLFLFIYLFIYLFCVNTIQYMTMNE